MAAPVGAEVGGTTYPTLVEAIAAANDGDTITLTGDVSATSDPTSPGLGIDKNLTIQGADANARLVGESANATFAFAAKAGATVIFENMTVSGFGDEVSSSIGSAAIFKIQSSATAGTKFIARYLQIEKFNRAAFAFFSGEFEITNCVIDCANSNTSHLTKGISVGYGTGLQAHGIIKNTTIKNANSTYQNDVSAAIEVCNNSDVTIEGCTLTNVQNGVTVSRYYTGGTPSEDAAATVKKTTIEATRNALEINGNPNNTNTGKATLSVMCGKYKGGIGINPEDDTCKLVIHRGYFSDDPSAFLAEGRTADSINKDGYNYMVGVEPVVTDITPSGTGVARSGNIVITFNVAMDAIPGAVTLDGTALTGGAWNDDHTIFTIPYSGLVSDKQYELMISGFKDGECGVLVAEDTRRFTTITDSGSGGGPISGPDPTPTLVPDMIVKVPKTGEGGGFPVWLGLLAAGALCISVLLLRRRFRGI